MRLVIGAPRYLCASASISMQFILHQYSIGNEAATDQCSKYAGHRIRCASDSMRLVIGAPPPVSVCNAYSISIRLETKRPLSSAANALVIRLGGLEIGALRPVSV